MEVVKQLVLRSAFMEMNEDLILYGLSVGFFLMGIAVCIWPFLRKTKRCMWGKILRIGIVLCHILFLSFLILAKNQRKQDPQDMSVALLWIYGFFVHIFLFFIGLIVRLLERVINKRMAQR